jgi:hypothetical protein
VRTSSSSTSGIEKNVTLTAVVISVEDVPASQPATSEAALLGLQQCSGQLVGDALVNPPDFEP